MTLKFGTDGIRGVANTELTAELSLALGQAAASVFPGAEAPFFVGRDPRLSGAMLQSALTAGLASAGRSVVDLGLTSTPAVAYVSAVRNAPAAMISASHNPFSDNGIKFFLPGGKKLSDEVEEQLEEKLRSYLDRSLRPPVASSTEVGSVSPAPQAASAYEDHLVGAFAPGALDRLRVVLDCANGAASAFAFEVFSRLGAEVTVLHAEPDLVNINDGCGSTHPQSMQKTVVEHGADLGLAFDGDADRVLAADHEGNLVDGDEIMGMLAIDAKTRGELKDDTLVLTVMSNLGLRLSMQRQGIAVHETKVGDRYVLEALAAHGWSLGGEQSGHVIFPELASTGDGLLTGLKVAALVRSSGQTLQTLAAGAMHKLPQVLRNVRVQDRDALSGASDIWDEVKAVESELGEEGRVLLRPSGTEPLVRVMIEAPTQEAADAACDRLCRVVERALSRS